MYRFLLESQKNLVGTLAEEPKVYILYTEQESNPMYLDTCPQCSNNLAPPMKSSGRQVCSSCGWTDKKRELTLPSDEPHNEPAISSDDEKQQKPIKGLLRKPAVTQELLRVSNYLLVGILAVMLYSLARKPSYEYEIVSPSALSFNESMNSYGQQGWKTVTCRRASSSSVSSESPTMSYECIMLREK